MDIVYIVRKGETNEDLRYSLRSLAANVTGYDKIFISGHMPSFIVRGIRYIPVEQKETKWRNALNNVIAACRHPKVSKNFVLFNDDFIATSPVNLETDLNLNRGSLIDAVDRAWVPVRKSAWQKGLIHTCDLIRSLGIDNPLDFSLHLPMVINKRNFLEMMDRIQVRLFLEKKKTLLFRTLYGNLYPQDGTRTMSDVKLRRGEDLSPKRLQGQWISVFDNVIGNEAAYPVLNEFLKGFPASRWEKEK